MTRTRIRSVFYAILFLACVITSPVEAARLSFLEELPPPLLLALTDTAREGRPLLRVQEEIPRVPKRVALFAAFEILGWEPVYSIVERISPGGFLSSLSRFLDPPLPSAFLEDPSALLQEQDLHDLLDWIRTCRISMTWAFSFEGDSSTLRLHKEGSAGLEGQWEVRILEGLEEIPAREELHRLGEAGFPVGLRQAEAGRFNLVVGPFGNFAKAREVYAALPPVPGMLLAPAPSQPGQPPLFWAALQTTNPDTLPVIRFASELGATRADLSALARSAGAEGGINGGFFSSSGPIGTLVVEGKPLRQSFGERSALGLSRGSHPVFGNGRLILSLETKNLRFPLDRLNERPLKDEVAVFLNDERFPAPSDPELGDVFSVDVTATVSGSFSLPPAGGTLLARGLWVESLKEIIEGEEANIHAKWIDSRFEGQEFVLQAGPRIVENRTANAASESFDEKTRLLKHPRSLVGWDGNSLWWIVIDGRNPSHSLGLTLEECAALTLSMGLEEVLNLDGGGSSALWWKDGLVNFSPGGKERPLPYAILFGVSPGSVFK
jgi:hypothetical protein